ncbi:MULTISPECIES: FadR/GntR family transcriptional regulator [unclassified Paenibacillus]|uniref:FadR/GntR family transcriptional regulator n=1 Tax=unclassified Paenibacillus TaxID=185978 RepID=UPI0009542324|nr:MULTISPECIES: FadR/GntR family transcriptional regulator [unclassified Paenibacillus]ASS66029.1 FadR family transcriptional regulator [Paenibacillus sp. RUD330]SIQ14903.1 GntR family transcriptional regulator, transcriptional repressor for pyruvate dehydrogenase complex [Paenibacillus sp. RU4X]SIQ36749.1 GntR family transcriptional regulator, transcriptional repressor for pyruvate dehydrogenase complex [Paenibacillus sp. RU4T]
MTIKKIKYHRVYEDVIEQLKTLILEGNLAPGDFLPTERELAQSFGISRGTLREAFRILEREGLIEARPGGGRFLSKSLDVAEDRSRILDNIERATIIELLEARELFETGIVELAAKRATEEDIAEIEAAFEAWGQIDLDGDRSKPDQAFHLSIAKATHNVVLVNMIELQMDMLQRTLSKTAVIPGRKSEVYEEHLLILQAIKERDPVKARLALLNHLSHVKDNIQRNAVQA